MVGKIGRCSVELNSYIYAMKINNPNITGQEVWEWIMENRHKYMTVEEYYKCWEDNTNYKDDIISWVLINKMNPAEVRKIFNALKRLVPVS